MNVLFFVLKCLLSIAVGVVLAMLVILLLVPKANATINPLEGYGASVTGGAGHSTFNVTNTNDSGSGSLRAAIASAKAGGGGIINFTVGGTVTLVTGLVVDFANVTIDGFTAPTRFVVNGSGGADICLTLKKNNDWFPTFGAADNIIVRGMTIDHCGGKSIWVAGATNVAIYYNSLHESGTDGILDVSYNAHEVTVSWNIIGGPADSGCSLVGYNAYHVSFHHNYWVDCAGGNVRIPVVDGQTFTAGTECLWPQAVSPVDTGPTVDVRYNLGVNWGPTGSGANEDGTIYVKINSVSNFYIPVDDDHAFNAFSAPSDDPLILVYGAGNAGVPNPTGPAWGAATGGCSPHFSFPGITTYNDAHVFPRPTPWSTPSVTGPGAYDQSARYAEWIAVRDSSGVVSSYTDDTYDAAARAKAVSLWPASSAALFALTWNQQSAPPPDITACNSLSPSSATIAVLGTQPYTGNCHYSDGSDAPCTASLSLSSGTPSVATVLGQTATGVSGGTSTISGTADGQACGNTSTLTVSVTATGSFRTPGTIVAANTIQK